MKSFAVFLFAALFIVFARAEDEHTHHEHVHDHEHEHTHGHEHHDHSSMAAVEVSASVREALGLRLARPERRRLAGLSVFTGRYELAPEARRAIVTPVAGRLRLNVKSFDKVVKGDLLFSVSAPDLVASADELRLLEKRLAVYRDLNAPNASLENEFAVKAAARVALLSGAEESNGVVKVRAPSDGVIEALPSTDGAWVEVGAEVVRLVTPDALRLKALVSPAEIGRLADGLACHTDEQEGELRIGLEAEGGLIPVYAVFRDKVVSSRVGARGSFVCEADRSAEEMWCVPRGAIVRVGLKSVVFLRDEHDHDRFLAHEVRPGVSAGGLTAVEGLEVDDDTEVVVEGAYELKLALPQEGAAKSSGHFHADGTFHEGED